MSADISSTEYIEIVAELVGLEMIDLDNKDKDLILESYAKDFSCALAAKKFREHMRMEYYGS